MRKEFLKYAKTKKFSKKQKFAIAVKQVQKFFRIKRFLLRCLSKFAKPSTGTSEPVYLVMFYVDLSYHRGCILYS